MEALRHYLSRFLLMLALLTLSCTREVASLIIAAICASNLRAYQKQATKVPAQGLLHVKKAKHNEMC